MRKVNLFVLSICFLTSLFVVKNVVAQQEEPFLPFPEDTPIPSPTPDPNIATPVTPQPVLSPSPDSSPVVIGGAPTDQVQYENYQKKYLELLEQYRAQEQIYKVAKAQYQQLNTLASQELAVQEARVLIDIRADIYTVYFDMLEYVLNQTKGIPIENKSPQLVKIRLLKETILLHKNINNSVLDRFALDQESLSFKNQIDVLQREAYYTLSLIRLGRVQHAMDKLISVKSEVEKNVLGRSLSSAQKAQKERGFDEIQRTIDQTNLTLAPINSEVFNNQRIQSLGDFSSLTSQLNPVFSGMNQTVEFLQEIRK